MGRHNNEIADTLEKIADLLEIQEANPFRVRAYRNAARTVSDLSRRVSEMLEEGNDLSELSGIGDDLAGKIAEISETGTLAMLEELEAQTSPSLREVMAIPGLGPKRVAQLARDLGIEGVEDLRQAIEDGKLPDLEGFGEKTVRNIARELEKRDRREEPDRSLLADVEEITRSFLEHLGNTGSACKITVAGSYRRRKETVGDIDILVTCGDPEPVMDSFVEYEDVSRVVSRGSTRSSVELRSGLRVDLRVIEDKSYGAALHYFTGSKSHNVAVRTMAVEQNLKINEYGVFRGEKRIAGETEEEVYDSVGLSFIVPELRENRGEIEAARAGELPGLIELSDLKGDLQMHTDASDGRSSLEEMAAAAADRGYEYIAITDHSKRVSMANGLDSERLAEQIERIALLNRSSDVRILASVEVDILKDGTLDLPDDILERLDLVVASVHYNMSLSRADQTARIIDALDNPNVNILAHPTGRLIGSREPYEVDIEKIMRAAIERGCFLEINADPSRLDLNDVYCKTAKDMGLCLSIGTDAHSPAGLKNVEYGVSQARRGWLSKHDVINTRAWTDLKKMLHRSSQ